MEALTTLALIWSAVYLAIVIARWTRLTPVLWYLFFGAVLVNTGLISNHPNEFIVGLSELAVLLIMFAIGFEEKTENFMSSLKKSWGIAFFGGLAPFLAAFAVAHYIWNDLNISLMCGLTMTATAVSLTMVSLYSEGLGKSEVATRIMTSAIIDDIASLALVAILVPIAAGTGSAGPYEIALLVTKAILFFVIVTILGTIILPHRPKGWIRRLPILGRFGIRSLLLFGKGKHATLAVLLLAVVLGLIAHQFGFHPAVGAFMAGLILKQEYFQFEGESKTYERTEQVIENIAFSWLGPIFFVVLGSHIILDLEIILSVAGYVVLLTLTLIIAQVASAALAARFTGQMDWPSSVMVGLGMLGRAELAFVVMDIAYIQNQILPIEAFYTLMLTAFWLNLAVPISIRLWKPVYEARNSKEAKFNVR